MATQQYQVVKQTTVQAYDKKEKKSVGDKFRVRVLKGPDGNEYVTVSNMATKVDHGMGRLFPIDKCKCVASLNRFDKFCKGCGIKNPSYKEA